ncbi:MAG: LCP family protein [Anaerolineaceae bacterium]|nr:LCP family protein [Anaerolineaceae bacterium]
MKKISKNQTLLLMGAAVLVCTILGLFLTGAVVRALVLNHAFPFELAINGGQTASSSDNAKAFADAIKKGLIEAIPQLDKTPTPVPSMADQLPDGQLNIALLGVDDYGEGNFRTDVIMILSLNHNHKTNSLISFPRDLYVTIPGCGENRINTAWVCGGFPSFQATFENSFGFKPTYYAMVNFDAFEAVVNSLDGIDVDVTQHFEDQCFFNNKQWCVLEPGVTHMDGEWALWYARARYSTSDFDRNRRAQDVVHAIAQKALSLNMLSKAPELYSLYREYVDTNLGIGTLLAYLGELKQITDPEKLQRYAITPEMAIDWIIPSGAQVLIPNYALIEPMLSEALFRTVEQPK